MEGRIRPRPVLSHRRLQKTTIFARPLLFCRDGLAGETKKLEFMRTCGKLARKQRRRHLDTAAFAVMAPANEVSCPKPVNSGNAGAFGAFYGQRRNARRRSDPFAAATFELLNNALEYLTDNVRLALPARLRHRDSPAAAGSSTSWISGADCRVRRPETPTPSAFHFGRMHVN
jgi:hypothetical protein